MINKFEIQNLRKSDDLKGDKSLTINLYWVECLSK